MHADQVVVGSGDDGRNFLQFPILFLRLEKILTNTAVDHGFPVFFEENIARGVENKKGVQHGGICGLQSTGKWEEVYTGRTSKIQRCVLLLCDAHSGCALHSELSQQVAPLPL